MKKVLFATVLAASLAFGFSLARSFDANIPAPTPQQRDTCGDRRCQPPEDCNSCPQDCGECCGNRRCEPPEDCNSCPQDCPC